MLFCIVFNGEQTYKRVAGVDHGPGVVCAFFIRFFFVPRAYANIDQRKLTSFELFERRTAAISKNEERKIEK